MRYPGLFLNDWMMGCSVDKPICKVVLSHDSLRRSATYKQDDACCVEQIPQCRNGCEIYAEDLLRSISLGRPTMMREWLYCLIRSSGFHTPECGMRNDVAHTSVQPDRPV